jgi:hypothetical protein
MCKYLSCQKLTTANLNINEIKIIVIYLPNNAVCRSTVMSDTKYLVARMKGITKIIINLKQYFPPFVTKVKATSLGLAEG